MPLRFVICVLRFELPLLAHACLVYVNVNVNMNQTSPLRTRVGLTIKKANGEHQR